ncbi:MAG: hypothetical protein M1838_001885 [Thelocarpon superellum]|nr:MAG: hypothetical protein M1838_001885 [Thelocarpon superellum]
MAPLAWPPQLGAHTVARDLPPLFSDAGLHERDASSIPDESLVGGRHLATPWESMASIFRRQTIVAIPSTYGDQNNSTPPGTVAGIVLGSVAGTVFVIWLFYLCLNPWGGRDSVTDEEVVVRARRGSRSSRRAETIEVSRSSSSSSRSRSRPRRSPVRETRTERIIVEERRSAPVVERDDDIVEVIEERDTPRRKRSNRNRVESGFRTVDPDRFAGGDRPVREVYEPRRTTRR